MTSSHKGKTQEVEFKGYPQAAHTAKEERKYPGLVSAADSPSLGMQCWQDYGTKTYIFMWWAWMEPCNIKSLPVISLLYHMLATTA
ncbi:hypothetical protein XENTR_v10008353 [Xenopus tropicalis]|nr:hypothetical protein XENTR_v10008353 [Xenopus tropicalis]